MTIIAGTATVDAELESDVATLGRLFPAWERPADATTPEAVFISVMVQGGMPRADAEALWAASLPAEAVA